MKNKKIIIYLHLDFAKTQENILELFLLHRTQRTVFIIIFLCVLCGTLVFIKFSYIHDFMIIILK
jgi:hypothetical protein